MDGATGGDGRALGRRRFLGGFLGVSVAALASAVLWPVLRYLAPPEVPEAATNRVLAGKISELTKVGWKTFPFGSEPGLLLRTPSGEYRAMSATCTHLGCTVQYDADGRRIWCACHNGVYDLQGRNVSGPPPRPLTAFKVEIEGDDIFVEKI